jgi:hypothetical protein
MSSNVVDELGDHGILGHRDTEYPNPGADHPIASGEPNIIWTIQ